MSGRARWAWSLLSAESDLLDVPGIGPAVLRRLERLGIAAVRDLLYHFPRDYIFRRAARTDALGSVGECVSVAGRVERVEVRPTRAPHLFLARADLVDEAGRVELFWFLPARGRGRAPRPPLRVGQRVIATGKVSRLGKRPQLRLVSVEPASSTPWRPGPLPALPVYKLTAGISQRRLAQWIDWAIAHRAAREWMPGALLARAGLPSWEEAIRTLHKPQTPTALERARRRVALEELVAHMVRALRERKGAQGQSAPACPVAAAPPEAYFSRLPFVPTAAQRRAVAALSSDLAQTKPMRRLLLGDVGSGKTAVMAYGVLRAVRSGFQAAVVVPTKILAEQHGRTLSQLLAPWGVRVDLYLADMKVKEREDVKKSLAAGTPGVAVGTHALLSPEVEFARLAFVALDEEHRFGVQQRRLVTQKGAAHLLAVSATPIPRTLALSLFADLDVTLLDEKPPGRAPVDTRWIHPSRRPEVYAFVRREVERGHQAYVVFPRIESEGDDQELAAVQAAERLAKKELAGVRLGLLHGGQPPAEQERTMAAFVAGRIDVLLATTVIEVGVDVPNATVMVIEGADRFGLAQLHQLRGRVGRAGKGGYCLMIADPATTAAKARIQALRRSDNGFEIAELDLALRGSGEFSGVRQSGQSEFKAVIPARDADLFRLAHQLARRIVDDEPAGGGGRWWYA